MAAQRVETRADRMAACWVLNSVEQRAATRAGLMVADSGLMLAAQKAANSDSMSVA